MELPAINAMTMPISTMKVFASVSNIVPKEPLSLNAKNAMKGIIYRIMAIAVQKNQIVIMVIKILGYVPNAKIFIISISKMALVSQIMKIMTLSIVQKPMGNAINAFKGLI
jgi:hypothetical protein